MVDIPQFSFTEFLELPNNQIAEMIKGLTVGISMDGTRRWLLLHYPQWDEEKYKEFSAKRCVEIYKMIFDHGVETIIAPAFSGRLLNRGDKYVHEMIKTLPWLAQYQIFTDFYRDYNVRVRFYGNWQRKIVDSPAADALKVAIDKCPATGHTGLRRIFHGIWADDMLVSILDYLGNSQNETVEFTREAIISHYYGEYVNQADIYIGFGHPHLCDIPGLVTSNTDLYFTTVPSLDIDARLFRMMVWDHLFGRRKKKKWHSMTEKDLEPFRAFYAENHDFILGVGDVDTETGIWYQRGLSPIDAFRHH